MHAEMHLTFFIHSCSNLALLKQNENFQKFEKTQNDLIFFCEMGVQKRLRDRRSEALFFWSFSLKVGLAQPVAVGGGVLKIR